MTIRDRLNKFTKNALVELVKLAYEEKGIASLMSDIVYIEEGNSFCFDGDYDDDFDIVDWDGK